ncbi:MAG: hypothetical protein AAF961_09565 [Planctomycetota bacterium]
MQKPPRRQAQNLDRDQTRRFVPTCLLKRRLIDIGGNVLYSIVG